MGSTAGTHPVTWEDLLALEGEDGLRYEIIGGELVVTSAPGWAHQRVVMRLGAQLLSWADRHGGEVVPGPNVYFTDTDVVVPDVVCVGPERLDRIDGLRFIGAPDLVVEVSSPSTRRFDLVRKRRLYEQHRVEEYWFVDLDAGCVQVYRLTGGRYPEPLTAGTGETIAPPGLPGLEIDVTDALGGQRLPSDPSTVG